MNYILFSTVFFLILSSGTFFGIVFKNEINIILMFLFFLSILLKIFSVGGVKNILVSYRVCGGLVVSCVLLLVSTLYSLSEHTATQLHINQFFLIAKIIIIFSYCLLYRNELDKFFKVFSFLIYYLSLFSLFLLSLKYIFDTDFLPMHQVGEVSTSFFSTYYGSDFSLVSLYRNSSIFYEPGLFSLMLAISFLWFINNDGYSKNVIVILFASLSTLSPAGFLICSFFIIKRAWQNPILRVAIVLPITVILVYYTVVYIELKSQSVSFSYRYNDFYEGLMLFFDNILFGVGPLNNEPLAMVFEEKYGLYRESSNGIITLLYQTGVIFSFTFIYFTSRTITKYLTREKMIYSIILVCVLLIFQPVQFSNLFLLFFVSGILIDEVKS